MTGPKSEVDPQPCLPKVQSFTLPAPATEADTVGLWLTVKRRGQPDACIGLHNSGCGPLAILAYSDVANAGVGCDLAVTLCPKDGPKLQVKKDGTVRVVDLFHLVGLVAGN